MDPQGGFPNIVGTKKWQKFCPTRNQVLGPVARTDQAQILDF